MLNRLSALDRDVLAHVEVSHDSVLDLARLLKLKPHKVQYALTKLKNLGIITGRRAWIDVHQLGYHYATVYLRPLWPNAKSRTAFIRSLAKNECCTWLFETSGEYHIACSLTFRSVTEVYRFYDSIDTSESIPIPKKTLSLQRDYEFFGRKYLRSPRCRVPSISLPVATTEIAIDQDDTRIISVLAAGNLGPDNELAQRCGLPYTTFNRRLSRLRSAGVVRGFYHWLDSSLLERQLFILRITAPGPSHMTKRLLWSFARENPLVIYILESIGSWDFELGVDLNTAGELGRIMEEIAAHIPGVALDIDPIAVTEFHKVRSFPG